MRAFIATARVRASKDLRVVDVGFLLTPVPSVRGCITVNIRGSTASKSLCQVSWVLQDLGCFLGIFRRTIRVKVEYGVGTVVLEIRILFLFPKTGTVV